MQDEWSKWTSGMERVRDANRPTSTASAMLAAVLLAVASEIGRAQLSAHELDAMVQQVMDRLAGRLG